MANIFFLQFSFYGCVFQYSYSSTSSDEISYSYRDYRLESYTMLFAKKRQDPFVFTLSLNHPTVVLRWRKQAGEGGKLLFGGCEDRYGS